MSPDEIHVMVAATDEDGQPTAHESGDRFSIPVLHRDLLIELACGHHNLHRGNQAYRDWTRGISQYDYGEVTPASHPVLLWRVVVNFLRHVASPYDRLLAEGADPDAIRDEVLDAIAKT